MIEHLAERTRPPLHPRLRRPLAGPAEPDRAHPARPHLLPAPRQRRPHPGDDRPGAARRGARSVVLQALRSCRRVDPGPPPGPPLPALVQTVGLLAFRRPYLNACRRRYGDVVSLRTLFGPRVRRRLRPRRSSASCSGRRPSAPAPARRTRPPSRCTDAPRCCCSTAPSTSASGACCRRRFTGERMRAYERVIARGGRPRDRLLAGRRAVRADAVDARVDARGDHAGGLRGRRRPRGRRARSARYAGCSRPRPGRASSATAVRSASCCTRRSPGAARRPTSSERTDVLSALIGAARDDEDEGAERRRASRRAGHAAGRRPRDDRERARLGARADPRRRARSASALEATLAAGDHDYLDAVIKETLRLRPVVTGLGRLVREAPAAGRRPTRSPPGIEVTPSIETIHADPASYPDPGEFRPERFLNDHAAPPSAWLPYGGGTRRCLGAAFASFEMRVVLARVLERTRLRPAGRSWPRLRRGVTPPTRAAFARALRRGRRRLPARGARVIQVATAGPGMIRVRRMRELGAYITRSAGPRSHSRRDCPRPDPGVELGRPPRPDRPRPGDLPAEDAADRQCARPPHPPLGRPQHERAPDRPVAGQPAPELGQRDDPLPKRPAP